MDEEQVEEATDAGEGAGDAGEGAGDAGEGASTAGEAVNETTGAGEAVNETTGAGEAVNETTGVTDAAHDVSAAGEAAHDVAAAGDAAHAGEAAHHGPLDQFSIHRFVDIDLGFDASFTNSGAMMVGSVVVISAIMIFGLGRGRLVPGRMQSLVEAMYEFVARMLGDTVGGKGAERAFPLVFSLFMFLLFGNVLGLIPFAFTFTSHIVITFIFAGVVFIGVTLLAIIIHKHKFLGFFLPPGVPMWMAPILVPIEIVSYLARPISLAVRLFANMLAGHAILHVFAAFVAALGFFGFLPFGFVVALYGLELLVACLQAYVFAILTCLYIRDAIHLHH